MNRDTQLLSIAGPAGALACAIDEPPASATPAGAPRGVAVICHPHPLHGGTMDNKVVHTLARAALQLGFRTVRFNFRGVGESAGTYDDGRGETDDALAAVAAHRDAALPLWLAGFSFGSYCAAQAAARLAEAGTPADRLVLVGPATSRFALPAVPPDTVVVHGEADEVVPLQATFDWARPQTLPVTVLPGVGHFFHGQLGLLKHVLVQALR
ncbi:alpha/beta hydrolase [Aquabacterium sp. OR-4]|uniref:alpha/beta hydrolase n=1 Tax=Aquabacterium sp. OR-4 TaxID=2978127 RepID=UPI0021B1FE60|nr:alpha/beta fold hydrolase [Aquabacterium sp. OR-4]MDT7834268.1 alpha/beta fold hydrolase [Aquabacterium sp. OR-4]